jgi:hypothetical protein
MQRVNPGTMDPMQVNNMSSMMGIMNTIQKIGKGNRKYPLDLDSSDKKFMGRFIDEIRKQFGSSEPAKGNGLYDFFNYVKEFTNRKGQGVIKLSYEEYEFLKKMIRDSLKGTETLQIPWYNLLKKFSVYMLKKQYAKILKKFR